MELQVGGDTVYIHMTKAEAKMLARDLDEYGGMDDADLYDISMNLAARIFDEESKSGEDWYE